MNFKSFLSENKKDYVSLLEGTMSDIHQLANDSKDIDSFTKDFFKQFGAKIKKTADSVEWVESLYSEMANEAYDGNMADFKYEFPTKFEEATGNSTKAIKKIAKKGKSGYEVRTSTYMSEPEMKLVADAMGMELKSYLKSTNVAISVFESLVTEKYTKKTLLKKLGDADDAMIQTGNGKEYIIYNPDSNNDDNAAMWNDKSVFAVDQDGEEHEIAYKDIGLVMVESAVTEAKRAGLSKKETLKVAQKFAAALTKLDGMKYTVSSDYEEDSFDLDIEDQDDVDPRITGEYAGGSYNINADGSVVNMAVWNKKNSSPVYGNMDDDIKTIIKTIKNIKESVVTESKITLKRRYTENHPALTVGKRASVRNKMLEAIGDGKITQEEFNDILKELSTNGKRWAKNNSRYFNVSEEGISLSKFGNRALASITINEEEPAKPTNTKPLEMKLQEATDENPGIWVPSGFDKAIAKLPNSQITRDVVLKVAKKHKVNPDEAISYVEYGWSLDLNENTNTNMKTQFIYESFGDFINSLNESESVINEAFKSSKLRNLLTMSDAMGWGKNDVQLPKAFYQLTKMKLDQVGDEDLIDMTPKEAYKAFANNRDMVVFFVVDRDKENPFGQGTLKPGLLALTRGKDFLGVQYEKTGRRDRSKKTLKGGDDRMAVGGNKAYKGYDASGVSSIKRAADLADRAIAFSLTNPMKSSAEDVSNRIDQKSGATAFKSDEDFKKANKARYQEILAAKASKLPLDKMVNDAIDALSGQIKDGLARNEKGRYGDIIIGRNSKGREAKMRDASNHMSNILDDYSRYVDYVKQAEAEKEDGYSSGYYERESKNYAKEIKDKVSKIKKFDYAW
jgi:hypothetical protein